MDTIPTGSDSTEIFVSRRELCSMLKESNCVKLEEQFDYLKKQMQIWTKCPVALLADLHHKLSHFTSEYKRRWLDAARMNERFLSKNQNWLDCSTGFPGNLETEKRKFGRPQQSFENLSERTKRWKTEDLRTRYSHKELSYASQMSLRSAGQTAASALVKEVTTTSPTRAKRYRRAFKKSETDQVKSLSGEEALSMIVEAKLTRHQYNIIRSKDKLKSPPYKLIQKTKKDCYISIEDTSITSTSAEVKLQALLDHTVFRLLQAQREVVEAQEPEKLCKLYLVSKWGFDGSSGQSEYKQQFDDAALSDASIFVTSLVPIQLIFGEPDSEQKIILWQNPRTSSTRYCSPIRFQFAHETNELAIEERQYIENQIKELRPSACNFNGMNILVTHKLLLTMVDGKICSSVTGTKSTLRCYICGLTSKDFNDLQKVSSKEIDVSKLEFGLSTLHGWIRFFEFFLHLSYKLPLQKWQSRGEEEKVIVAEQKKLVQSKFKTQFGLLVDKPKPGFGSTNDGNTARRFFHNAEISAAITGVDVELIKRCYIVLQTISSGYKNNLEKFKTYARETAQICVEKYSWYPMPTSVHKILMHGPEVIAYALLPIGQLSEDAQEARNKDFKRYRESFSRKISRTQTNEDILHSLLVSSDPYISTFRHLPQRIFRKFDKEVLDMLESPEVANPSSEQSLQESSAESNESTTSSED